MQKRNHHYVPQFYLKGFLDRRVKPPIQPSLWVYDKKTGEQKKRGTRNVGSKNGYYDLKLVDGQITTVIEDFFKYKIEDPTIPILRKILNQSLINDDEKLKFSYFIYFSLARVPNFLNYMSWFYKNIAPKNKLSQSSEVLSIDNESIEKVKEEGLNTLEFMIEMGDVFIPLIYSMNWQFYVAPQNKFFVTSDNPVILNDPNQRKIYPSFVGWENPDIHLIFPLNSTICLRARWGKIRKTYVKADLRFMRAINFRTSFYATRYIFSSRPIEAPLLDVKFLFNETDTFESKQSWE